MARRRAAWSPCPTAGFGSVVAALGARIASRLRTVPSQVPSCETPGAIGPDAATSTLLFRRARLIASLVRRRVRCLRCPSRIRRSCHSRERAATPCHEADEPSEPARAATPSPPVDSARLSRGAPGDRDAVASGRCGLTAARRSDGAARAARPAPPPSAGGARPTQRRQRERPAIDARARNIYATASLASASQVEKDGPR